MCAFDVARKMGTLRGTRMGQPFQTFSQEWESWDKTKKLNFVRLNSVPEASQVFPRRVGRVDFFPPIYFLSVGCLPLGVK